jgi:hypothetical protein
VQVPDGFAGPPWLVGCEAGGFAPAWALAQIRFHPHAPCWNTGVVGALRPEEHWAREIIAHALRVPVVQHDDGTVDGMHDLDVVYPDRPCAAVEVTTAADGESIALWNLLNGGGRWIEPTLSGGWTVSLLPTARAKRVRKELPPLLEMLERSGIKEFHLGHFRADPALVQLAGDLGVSDLYQSDTNFPGSIYPTVELGSDRSGGMVAETGEALGTWVGEFLLGDQRSDVREKLLRSGAEERHAFVIVPSFARVGFSVMELLMRDDAPLPEAPPALPVEVNRLWATSSWSSARGMRWSPDQGWSYFDKMVDVDSGPD